MLKKGILGGCFLAFFAGNAVLSFAGEDISQEKIALVEEGFSDPVDTQDSLAAPEDALLPEGAQGAGIALDEEAGPVVPYASSYVPWEFRTSASSSLIWDANYTRKPRNPKSEVIYGVGPVFTMVRKHAPFISTFRYAPTYRKYAHSPKNDKLDHSLRGKYHYNFSSFYLDGSDDMLLTSQGGASEDSSRSKIFSNTFANELGWHCSEKVSLALKHRYLRHTYLTPGRKTNSYQAHGIGPRVYYHIRPKIDIYFQRMYSFYDYYNTGQNDSINVVTSLGVRGAVRKDTVLQAELGVQSRDYKRSSSADQENFWMEGILRRRLSKKTSLTFSAKQELQESTFQNANAYEALILTSTVSYRYSPKTSGVLALSWQSNGYSQEATVTDSDTGVTTTAKRQDDIYTARLSLDYALRHNLSLNSSISCSRRDSNFPSQEYEDQTVSLSANYAF